MENLSTSKYDLEIKQAIKHFWNTRNNQTIGRTKADQGNRSAVTGGKQLDGFIALLARVAKDLGIPDDCIFTKGNHLPGFFRPTANAGKTLFSHIAYLDYIIRGIWFCRR